MSTNGNGKANLQVVEAQREVERTKKPMLAAQERAASTRMRLAECQQALAVAQQDHDKSAERYTDNDSAANRAALFRSAEDVKAAESRVQGFTRKLAAEEAEIPPLNDAHQTAVAQLAHAQMETNRDEAEQQWRADLAAQAKLEEQLQAARVRTNASAVRYNQIGLQIRDAQWAATQQASREKFLRDNPSNHPPARTHVRQGF